MSNIKITKKDILWSYIAKILQIGTGFITLPLILHLLTPEEIGMNYLMLTVSSIVALLDFGFSPQFGRNFTYVNSGAKRLLKEGVEYADDKSINYHLLSVLLETAKYVYRRLSIICLMIMLTLGTLYIYHVTEGFKNVEHSFSIWILFSISIYFNVYFTYYNSLLIGSGKVAEANIATILVRISYLIICIPLLLKGWGLFAIIIANILSPFVQRFYSHKKYFTKNILMKLDSSINSTEIKCLYNIIWYNAKKLGINFLGSYAINKSGMFLIGLFLPLTTVGSYGLLVQLTTILMGIAQIPFITYQPKFANLRVSGEIEEFKSLMSITILSYWIIMILGSIVIVILCPLFLELLGSKTILPSISVISIYLLTTTLEGNHSNFATLIVTDNKVPFVTSGLISGGIILFVTFILLQYTNLALLGVVIVPFIVQLAYNNWYWPKWILDEFNMSPVDFINCGKKYISYKLYN